MSSNQDSGNGGHNIFPSARKGIHNQARSIFTIREGMVRYGEESSDDDDQPAPRDAGTDEVDNVMSKFAHTSSPLVTRKTRRNSMTPPNQQYTDDSDDDALAKSLPATLPSYSNYRDEFNARHGYGFSSSNQLDESVESVANLRSRSNRSIDSRSSSFSRSNLSSKLNQSKNRKPDKNSAEGTIFTCVLALLGICSAAYYYDFVNLPKSNHVKYDELRFHSDLTELGAKYEVGGNSVLKIQAGISTVFKREDTSCFIFVYNSLREDFNSNKFDGFVNNVASNAAKFLRNDTALVQHIVVDGSDLNMRSHTQLVKAYREDMSKTGVLLVRDMEHVPSSLAMAFHYYCDEYNPLVKKSAVFFTLNTAKCHNSEEKSTHASVEKCLKEKWNTVPKDNIGPLLTRVVSVVVDVTN